MTKSIQFVAATALLSLALSGSAQASFALGPYAYAAAADVDNLNSAVEDMTFKGSPTGLAQYVNSWAQTDMGVHHVVAAGDGTATRYGALSAWSDAFTITGGVGNGVANVSLSIDGALGNSPYATAGYVLLKTANPVLPGDLMNYYLAGGALPLGAETVRWGTGDSAHDAGVVKTVLTGSFNYTYDSAFYLTSVFGAVAAGAGSANFGDTATFGISVYGDIGTGSGATYLAAAVPEPETWAMLLIGLGLIGLQARRRHFMSKALSA